MKRLTYLSLGAGVQSTALLILSATGRCERADVAIFADTGDEPQWVYEHLERLKAWSPIPIEVVSRGHLSADNVALARYKGQRTRMVLIPAFTRGRDGQAVPTRRQCTHEYKIQPIERRVKELMGFAKGERVVGRGFARALIGISLDEATRMKPSRTRWVESVYPLVELGLRRKDCLRVIANAGLPEPKKSSCVFCPYHGDEFWRTLQRYHPDEFARAAAFDDAIRDMGKSGRWGEVFVHRSLRPLRTIDFNQQGRLFGDLEDEECDGGCFL